MSSSTDNAANSIHSGESDNAVNNLENKFDTTGVVTMASAHAVHDTYTGFLPALYPELISKLTITRAEAGLFTFFMQVPSIVQPIIGYLADRASLKYLVILSPAITAILMSLLGLASSYAIVALMLIIVGLSSASLHAVAPAVAGHLSGKNLGKGMSFWMVGGEIGRTLGPLIVVTAIRYFSFEGTGWLMVFGILASLLLYLRLRNVSARPNGRISDLTWKEALIKMKPVIIPVAGILTAMSFLFAAVATFLPTFLTEEGTGLWMAGASLTMVEAAGVVGAMIAGPLSDRFGRRIVLLVIVLCAPVFLLLTVFTSSWLRFVFIVIAGFFAIAQSPVFMALSQESCPENRALANGIYNSISFAIRSTAVIVLGAIGDAYSLHTAYIIGAILVLFAIPFVFILPKNIGKQDQVSL